MIVTVKTIEVSAPGTIPNRLLKKLEKLEFRSRVRPSIIIRQHRQYLSRKEEGRELTSIQDSIDLSIQ